MSETLTPEDVVRSYMRDIWNAGDVERIRTICADPVIRHHPDRLIRLSHDDQIERIVNHRATSLPSFEPAICLTDGSYVTAIWNGHYANGKRTAAIEVFKVVEGRITEVWNNTSEQGTWA